VLCVFSASETLNILYIACITSYIFDMRVQ
jgi:hypothetical protein